MKYLTQDFPYRIHPSTTKPTEYEVGMCTGKTVEMAHFVATVSTRVSAQTITQKSTVRSTLAT